MRKKLKLGVGRYLRDSEPELSLGLPKIPLSSDKDVLALNSTLLGVGTRT